MAVAYNGVWSYAYGHDLLVKDGDRDTCRHPHTYRSASVYNLVAFLICFVSIPLAIMMYLVCFGIFAFPRSRDQAFAGRARRPTRAGGGTGTVRAQEAPIDRTPAPYRMAGGVALAWLGMYVHNVADLPNLTLLSPGMWCQGRCGWCCFSCGGRYPAPPRPTGLLLAWGTLNLVGGFATVLPLPILPFEPEQTLRHYLFHVLAALTELPLLALAWHALRARRSGHEESA